MKNILFITLDQWRGDCLAAAGNPVIQTPNLDRIAGEGTMFLRHYAGSVPCSPARACLYTGLYQMINRVCINGTPLDARHDNIAKAARRFGYDPTLFGYSDQSIDPRMVAADDPRLTTYEGVLPGLSVGVYLDGGERPWLDWLAARGHVIPDNPVDIHLPRRGPADPPTTDPPVYGADETQTAFLTDAVIDFIDRHDRPGWFAHVSYLRPHPPFIVPEPYNRMYDPATLPDLIGVPSAEAAQAQHPILQEVFKRSSKGQFVEGARGAIADWTDDDLRRIRATYYGMVSEVDAQIGRLIDHLQATGAWADTLIVVTGDHGEMLGDHRLLGKLGYFDQSYHVPLIVRDPARPDHRGGTVRRFTEAVDIMPTLLDAVGAPVPRHLSGRSLVPFLEGRTPDRWRKAAHYEWDFRQIAGADPTLADRFAIDQMNLCVLRGERFKYVHCAAMPPLLFDLKDDPGETINLAEDPDFTTIRLICAEEMLTWRATHLDRTLTRIELSADGPVTAETPI